MKQTCSKAVLFIAAFFVFLALTSCGIPTILYLDSNDYIFTAGKTTDTKVSISSLVVTTSNYEDYAGVGPAVMFFYTIGIGESYENNSFASGSTVESAFANKYIPTITQGRPITSNEVVSFTLNGKQRTLYAFRGADGQDFRAQEEYMLSSNNGLFAELTDAKLTYDTSSGVFSLSPSSYSSHLKDSHLYRYKGTNLSFSSDSYTFEKDDFSAVSNNPVIHIYAAFCISPNYSATSGTSFNNIYWSSLKYLGYIKLNQST